MASADFTIADVLAWARTKPADERYDFTEARECAVAQFGLATGRHHLVGLCTRSLRAVSEPLFWAVLGTDDDHTFGALIKRLEKLVQETPVTPSEWTRIDAYLTEQVSA